MPYIYEARESANGPEAPFTPTIPNPTSKMAQDRETRTGHKEGIALILRAPYLLRHTNVRPDPFATVIDKGELRITHSQMASAIVNPVVQYALDNPDSDPADALAFVLAHPVTVESTRNTGAKSGASGFAALADTLVQAISAARAAKDAIGGIAPEPDSDEDEDEDSDESEGVAPSN